MLALVPVEGAPCWNCFLLGTNQIHSSFSISPMQDRGVDHCKGKKWTSLQIINSPRDVISSRFELSLIMTYFFSISAVFHFVSSVISS